MKAAANFTNGHDFLYPRQLVFPRCALDDIENHRPALQVAKIISYQSSAFPIFNIFVKIYFRLQIGLMRSGRLLAEESPQVLLSMYGCQSLEEVFLKLSRKQGSSNAQNQAELNISNNISLVRFHEVLSS